LRGPGGAGRAGGWGDKRRHGREGVASRTAQERRTADGRVMPLLTPLRLLLLLLAVEDRKPERREDGSPRSGWPLTVRGMLY
jgi:hypothetical protein